MPERDRTEERRQLDIDIALVGGDAETPEEKNAAWNRISAAYDRLITEADTAERENEWAQERSLMYAKQVTDAKRDLDEARKALVQIGAEIDQYGEWTQAANDVLAAALASLSSDRK